MKRERRLNVDFYEFAAGRGRHLQGVVHTSSSSNQAAGKHCSRMCLEGWGDRRRGGGSGREEKEEAGKRGWIPSLGRGWAMDFLSSQGWSEGNRWGWRAADVWRCCRSSLLACLPRGAGGTKSANGIGYEAQTVSRQQSQVSTSSGSLTAWHYR